MFALRVETRKDKLIQKKGARTQRVGMTKEGGDFLERG